MSNAIRWLVWGCLALAGILWLSAVEFFADEED